MKNRGIWATMTTLLVSTQAQAHSSHAQGMAHAMEHLWWLLVLVPAVLLFHRSLRNKKH